MDSERRITYRDHARGDRAQGRGVVDGDVLAALLLTAPAFVWIVVHAIARRQPFDAGTTLSAALALLALVLLLRAALSWIRGGVASHRRAERPRAR